MRREVTRVITPGTATDAQLLEPGENNFLAAVSYAPHGGNIGMAWVDISTGEFNATEFSGADAEAKLRDEMQLLRPREMLLPRVEGLFADAEDDGPGNHFAARMELREGAITRIEEWIFRADYGERMLTGTISGGRTGRIWARRSSRSRNCGGRDHSLSCAKLRRKRRMGLRRQR